MASQTAVQGTETDLEIAVAYESNNGGKHSEVKKHRRKNVIHLWEFLLELIAKDNLCTIICWSRRELKEFQVKRPEEVSRRWGLLRKRKGMNYEKLSRALRFYYGKGIIQKVPGQQFTYKFDKLLYRYEPEVSQARNKDSKLSSCDQEQNEVFLINLRPVSVNNRYSRLHLSSQHCHVSTSLWERVSSPLSYPVLRSQHK
ncbi:ETS domain-containing protein Elk-3-like [Stylophora pistillata]|uniref:ETS domain-containing protein Elk-3-like n=1 Tax=Stylophora pistillata TaxID=50429 RepID=UPI000C041103|nr:ETS domain-containing protein Elk-3-like [Stylophora pistillata]